jgi:hypothetical protein
MFVNILGAKYPNAMLLTPGLILHGYITQYLSLKIYL